MADETGAPKELTASQERALGGLKAVWEKVYSGEITSLTLVGTNAKGDIQPFSHVDTMADLLYLLGAQRVLEGDMVDTLRSHLKSKQQTKTAGEGEGRGEPAGG